MASAQPTSQSYEHTILRQDMRRWLSCRNPEAWGQYRDAAAKALPWFTNVQGGVCLTTKDSKHPDHTPELYVRGILISEWTGANSYLDAEVIITSIHSVMEKLSDPAKNRCEAVENTYNEKRLVGCLVGIGATKLIHPDATAGERKRKRSPESAQSFFPCPVPKNQTAFPLGFYIITDTWKTAVKKTPKGKDNEPVTMLRLERWDLENKVWFARDDPSHDPPPLSARDYTIKATIETCKTCNKPSPRMFEEFFLCRNPDCDDFWRHEGEVILQNLTYTKPYLQQRERRDPDGYKLYGAYKGSDSFPKIAENFSDWWEEHYNAVKDEPITVDNYSQRMQDLNEGFWCPLCGMLNRRLKWTVWDCANKNCPALWNGRPTIVPATQIVEIGKTAPPDWTSKLGYKDTLDMQDGYVRHNYDLRYGCGITVIVPKTDTNARHQGSDWLWDRVQHLANDRRMDLQKQFVSSASKGTVSDHFIHNYGKEYRLAVDIRQQTSFEDAPQELSNARDFVNSICRRYQSPPGSEDFNECYVAGYFTNNHMGWHSDGEKGLGSVIATWTLGGEGRMFVCANSDQYFGRRGNGDVIDDDDLVLVGVKAEAERRVLKDELDAKLAVDPPLTADERAVILKEYRKDLGALVGTRGASSAPHRVLEIPLTHGSIVVMHGAEMQKHYRHAVEVKTPLRVALTFRHITEENSEVVTKPAGEYPHVPDQSYQKEFSRDVEGGEGEEGAASSKRPRVAKGKKGAK